MRKIKFRAWDTEPSKGHFVDCSNHEIYRLNSDLSGLGNRFIYQEDTGLKDKIGASIYEGDIVEWDTEPCEVIFISGAWRIQPSISWSSEEFAPVYQYLCEFQQADILVVGNIYENPEILKASAA